MRSFILSLRWLVALLPAAAFNALPLPAGSRSASPHAPAAALVAPTAAATDTGFAHLVAELSEAGGYFDSDNLISNETSYLHVLDAMQRLHVQGGAYVGVGPDQNFSYIAAVRPSIAFVIDIRRDNLLEHLLFKAIFAMSRNRLEYLCLLFGKPVPSDLDRWSTRPIGDLVDYVDRTRTDPDVVDSVQSAVSRRVKATGIPLTAPELETIARIRDAFVRDSLGLRYSSIGRAPRPYHPTYRRLLLETDRAGAQRSFLADEPSFQFVKSLEARDLVVPVVGNVAGDHALAAIGAYAERRRLPISVFYISNVEQYLIRDGGFNQFAENVKRLPRDRRSVMIRSLFGMGGGYGMGAHPLNVAGHYSTQILQTMDAFVAAYDSGAVRSYYDLVSRGYVAP